MLARGSDGRGEEPAVGPQLSAPLGVALIGWGGVILLNRLVLLG